MNLSANMTSGIGQPVRRKEDFRLLTGRGSFADDIHLPELAHAVIVRSPHAHAHIESIDKAAALASPGVLKVLTGHDYVADGLMALLYAEAVGGTVALVAGLSRDQAEAVALRVIAGLDTAAVARLLGKSPGAVRVALHRGLRVLAADPRLRALEEADR